ncbi:MAG: ComEC/Rec2 family competence protein [Opitutales bacterium]|nr:ComEC/Rec2 family competence protein [Opitutales bacterium]
MRYPIGFFGFVCGFTLIGARGILTKMPTGDWLIYLTAWFLFLRLTHVRIVSKKFLLNFLISLAVAAHMIFICTRQPTRGRYVRGTFQFDKLFRTQPKRIGGIGQLTLSNGETFPLYLHAPTKKDISLNDTECYHFAGYVKPLRNPFRSSQNFSFYLWSRSVRNHSTHARLTPLAQQPPTFLQRCRKSLFAALTVKDEHLSHVWRAILMGKKEALSKDQIQHFFYTGTMHLFAVSGLHVGVIGTFFFFLGRLLLLPKILRLLLTGCGVWLYAAVVGFGPSTLRATLMITFVLLAQLFSRPVSGQNVFFNTVGLTLFFNPFELWDVGFQLSYGTVASILCVGVPLSLRYVDPRQRFSSLKATVIVSFCASVISSLFSMRYWDLFSPWAFVANLLLIPFASFIVILGMLSWGIFLLFPLLLTLTEPLSSFCLRLLLKSVEVLENLPGAIFKIPVSSGVFALCLWMFAIVIGKTERRKAVATKEQ